MEKRPVGRGLIVLALAFRYASVYVIGHSDRSVRSPQTSDRAQRANGRGSGKELDVTWSTYAVMTKQHKTALNMAKFIQAQSLLLLEKLNELDLDTEADLCEKLHEDAEQIYRTLAIRLGDRQGDL